MLQDDMGRAYHMHVQHEFVLVHTLAHYPDGHAACVSTQQLLLQPLLLNGGTLCSMQASHMQPGTVTSRAEAALDAETMSMAAVAAGTLPCRLLIAEPDAIMTCYA
jgi:hypothetical protein